MKKWDLRQITKIEATADFRLVCTFDTKEVKAFDMRPLLNAGGPMIEPLRRISFFRKVFVESGTPTWPNGYDICADLLYQKGIMARSKGRAA